MRILLLGADGFIGRAMVCALEAEHAVIRVGRHPNGSSRAVDLARRADVANLVKAVGADVVMNCAGNLVADTADLNQVITDNVLAAVNGNPATRIVLCGSAAVYGEVSRDRLPVDESVPLAPTSDYGRSKAAEESSAEAYREKYDAPVVIARIFNAVGPDMHPRLLLPRLIQQVAEIRAGQRDHLEVSRLDSLRDYVYVADLARALAALATCPLNHDVYNIGSGVETSTAQLVDLVARHGRLASRPPVVELSPHPEPQVASQADVTRIRTDVGWSATTSLDAAIAEVSHV